MAARACERSRTRGDIAWLCGFSARKTLVLPNSTLGSGLDPWLTRELGLSLRELGYPPRTFGRLELERRRRLLVLMLLQLPAIDQLHPRHRSTRARRSVPSRTPAVSASSTASPSFSNSNAARSRKDRRRFAASSARQETSASNESYSAGRETTVPPMLVRVRARRRRDSRRRVASEGGLESAGPCQLLTEEGD
jgi:hypothetical protein